jgi:hypothetical protein
MAKAYARLDVETPLLNHIMMLWEFNLFADGPGYLALPSNLENRDNVFSLAN